MESLECIALQKFHIFKAATFGQFDEKVTSALNISICPKLKKTSQKIATMVSFYQTQFPKVAWSCLIDKFFIKKQCKHCHENLMSSVQWVFRVLGIKLVGKEGNYV